MKKLLLALTLLGSQSALAWTPYVVCNDGDLVVDIEERYFQKIGPTVVTQFVVRDEGVVEHFKSNFQQLYTIYDGNSVYLANGEMLIPSSTIGNGVIANNLSAPQSRASISVEFQGRREGRGVRLELTSSDRDATWLFENCRRVNTWTNDGRPYSRLNGADPLNFWDVQRD